jgi:hypothetical protein
VCVCVCVCVYVCVKVVRGRICELGRVKVREMEIGGGSVKRRKRGVKLICYA